MNQCEPTALEAHLLNIFREEEAKDFEDHYLEIDYESQSLAITVNARQQGDDLMYSNLLSIDRIRSVPTSKAV